MKKVILFFVVAMAFASCGHKAAETAPATDSVAVEEPVVEPAPVADTTAVDTTAAPVQ